MLGDDSLGINSINEMGVNLAAVHGLIDRTDALNDTILSLKANITLLEAALEEEQQKSEALKKELLRVAGIEEKNLLLDEKIEELSKKIDALIK